MRIAFLTQEDPLYILPFFQSFFEQADARLTVVGIYACRSMGKRKRTKLLRELVGLYRIGGFLKLLALQIGARLQAALVPGSSSSIRSLCTARQIHYQHIDDPNQQAIVSELAKQNIDVLVSIACPYILKQDLLSLPAKTSINLHHAPLPRYKGMMPTFWQMYHRETAVGVTVHTVAKKLDEGPALFQDRLPIEPGETLHQLIRRSKRFGAAAVIRVLHSIDEGTATPLPLADEQGSYFTFPTKTEMDEFHRRRLRAI
jgi:methionyl-tRNA formyltransferase